MAVRYNGFNLFIELRTVTVAYYRTIIKTFVITALHVYLLRVYRTDFKL